jgi:hypothetical protein
MRSASLERKHEEEGVVREEERGMGVRCGE